MELVNGMQKIVNGELVDLTQAEIDRTVDYNLAASRLFGTGFSRN